MRCLRCDDRLSGYTPGLFCDACLAEARGRWGEEALLNLTASEVLRREAFPPPGAPVWAVWVVALSSFAIGWSGAMLYAAWGLK